MAGISARVVSTSPTYNAGQDLPLTQTEEGALRVEIIGGGGTVAAAAYTTETNSTITLGGTAQNAVAANAARTRLKFQNLSTGDIWVKTTGTAAIGTGMWLPPGAYYEWPTHDIPSGALSVIGATTGQAYFVAEG